MKLIKGVIFDMDGLMLDTERLATLAWVKAGADFGFTIDEDFLNTIRGCIVQDSKRLFCAYFGDGFDYDAIRDRKAEYLAEIVKEEGIPVKKGLHQLLEYLKQNRYTIALATSTRKEIALQRLKDAEVYDYFHEYICGDMVSVSKPDPAIFLLAANKLQLKPEECLVLEDSINGVKAGIAGGFPTIMVPDLAQPSKELEEQLYGKCESLDEIIKLLEQ